MAGFTVRVEQRRNLGLPAAVLAEARWPPGSRVVVGVGEGDSLVLTPLATVLKRYVGTVAGLSAFGTDGRVGE